MAYLQHQYTSCRHGLGSGAGWQTRAASSGLGRDEMRDIQQKGGYIPASGLPKSPTPEEIAAFPVKMAAYRLGNGRPALSHACYVGTDYSGRFGNAFLHTLVAMGDQWDDYPIIAWGAGEWKRELRAGEDSEDAMLELAPLDRLPVGGLVDPKSVRDFLLECAGVDHVEGMLNALLDVGLSHRRLVIRAEGEAIPFWIGAMLFSLPLYLVTRVSFTTYSDDPARTDFLINGLVEGVGVELTTSQTRFQYHYFDPYRQVGSNAPSTRVAAWLASLWKQGDFDTLTQFHLFLAGIGWNSIDASLELAHALYTRLDGGTNTAPAGLAEAVGAWTPEDRAKLFDWLYENGHGALLADIGDQRISLAETPLAAFDEVYRETVGKWPAFGCEWLGFLVDGLLRRCSKEERLDVIVHLLDHIDLALLVDRELLGGMVASLDESITLDPRDGGDDLVRVRRIERVSQAYSPSPPLQRSRIFRLLEAAEGAAGRGGQVDPAIMDSLVVLLSGFSGPRRPLFARILAAVLGDPDLGAAVHVLERLAQLESNAAVEEFSKIISARGGNGEQRFAELLAELATRKNSRTLLEQVMEACPPRMMKSVSPLVARNLQEEALVRYLTCYERLFPPSRLQAMKNKAEKTMMSFLFGAKKT